MASTETSASELVYTPKNGTEQFFVSSIDIIFFIIILLFINIYARLARRFKSLGKINERLLNMVLKDVTDPYKKELQSKVVKEVRDKEIEIPVIDKMDTSVVKKYEGMIKDEIIKEDLKTK